MKAMLKQSSQSRLEARDGILCIVMETPFNIGESGAASPAMRQWFRVEEPEADSALVAGRPVRNLDPQQGLFVDEEGNSYRLAGGGQAEPDYAEVIPVEGGPRLEVDAAPMAIKQRSENGSPVTGRRRRKGREKPGAIPDELFSDQQPNQQELNLREKFAEVRRRLGYVQKRGHNELMCSLKARLADGVRSNEGTIMFNFPGSHRSSESRKATYLPFDALTPLFRAAAATPFF